MNLRVATALRVIPHILSPFAYFSASTREDFDIFSGMLINKIRRFPQLGEMPIERRVLYFLSNNNHDIISNGQIGRFRGVTYNIAYGGTFQALALWPRYPLVQSARHLTAGAAGAMLQLAVNYGSGGLSCLAGTVVGIFRGREEMRHFLQQKPHEVATFVMITERAIWIGCIVTIGKNF